MHGVHELANDAACGVMQVACRMLPALNPLSIKRGADACSSAGDDACSGGGADACSSGDDACSGGGAWLHTHV